MSLIAQFCKDLQYHKKTRKQILDVPVGFWSEKDRFNENTINAFVIIFKTKGCSWNHESGCSMCGYYQDSVTREVSDENLLGQFQKAMQSYQDEPVVKIFNSGSFFDEDEVSIAVRNTILSTLSKKTLKISVESRPEFVKKETLNEISDFLGDACLEVGIGLESANDIIRKEYINKGFSFQEYKEAAIRLSQFNHLLKTYVLMKPPFLSEQQAIFDTIETIKTISEITDTISLNPTNVQNGTLVEYLWKRNYYRPPWLWSIHSVLTQAVSLTNKRIQCDIVGGGNIRGPHNCKRCDTSLLKSIRKFSLSQNIDDLNHKSCECKKQWRDQCSLEPLSYGSLVDIQRGLIS